MAVSVLLGLLLVAVGVTLGPWQWLFFGIAALGVGFTFFFFRDPERTPPSEAAEGTLLLAPADGRVVEVVEEEEPHYLGGWATRVSIFLSPLNVHVNRVPADGVIEFEQYVPGDYLVAWHPKASEKNERSELGLRHPSGTKILFKQIAGAVARRIVYHIREGDEVKAGERFGIVKFGSRMDVFVPSDIEVEVQEGQRARAGETVLGRLPKVPAPAEPTATRTASSA